MSIWWYLMERGRKENQKSYCFLFGDCNMRIVAGFCGVGKTEFMHHPVSFHSLSGTSSVVNQWFLEANAVVGILAHMVDWPVYSSCFPETRASHSVGPYAIPVLSPPSAKEVPLFFCHIVVCFWCNNNIKAKTNWIFNHIDLNSTNTLWISDRREKKKLTIGLISMIS